MRGLIRNRILAVVAVVIAVAAAAGLTMLNRSVTLAAGSNASAPGAAPVGAVARACPAPGLAGATASRVAVIAGPTASGPGRAEAGRLSTGKSAPLFSVTRPGALSIARVRPAPAVHAPSPAPSAQHIASVPTGGGVVIRATGSMARGLETEQVSSEATQSAHCDGPSTDFWFVGPGRSIAAHIRLFLMNTGSQPADVNVEADTDAGPLLGSPDTGIAVAPHSMVVQTLDTMLRGSRVIALHVRTSVGQVVAAVEETTGTSHGGAWLPAAQPPATKVVIPGLPSTAGTRELFVTVPGTRDAHIVLTAVTSKGSYQPTGGGGLDIPAGSAVSVSLPSLGGIPGALRVSSTVPVTASVLLPGGQHGTPGVFTTATPPIEQQGMVAVNLGGHGKASGLVLSAPWRAARARITEIAEGTTAGTGQSQAPGSGQTVQIAAKRSLVVKLSPPPGASRRLAFAVVVTPLAGSGQLYAGRVLAGSGTGGALLSIQPVSSALTSVPLPPVRVALITPAP